MRGCPDCSTYWNVPPPNEYLHITVPPSSFNLKCILFKWGVSWKLKANVSIEVCYLLKFTCKSENGLKLLKKEEEKETRKKRKNQKNFRDREFSCS